MARKHIFELWGVGAGVPSSSVHDDNDDNKDNDSTMTQISCFPRCCGGSWGRDFVWLLDKFLVMTQKPLVVSDLDPGFEQAGQIEPEIAATDFAQRTEELRKHNNIYGCVSGHRKKSLARFIGHPVHVQGTLVRAEGWILTCEKRCLVPTSLPDTRDNRKQN